MLSGRNRAGARQLTLGNLRQAARLQWWWSHTSSVLVGAAIAWKDGFFDPALLLVTWLGVEMIHAGACMTNDYWDHRSGADEVGEHTIFNAGSRVIQENKISPEMLLVVSFICYLVGAAAGIFLVVTRGLPILALGVAGVLLGYFYTAPPVKLCYRGFDHVSLALSHGPLIILGSYYVQAQRFTLEVLLIGLVYGTSASMILYAKQFHGTDFDRQVGKESVVVKLGTDRAASLFLSFYLAAYAIVAVGVLLRIVPLWMVAVAGSTVLVRRARAAMRDYVASGRIEDFFEMLVQSRNAHLFLGYLLIIGYAAMGIVMRV